MSAATATVTLIKDLTPGMNNLNLQVIALDIGRPNTVKDNQEVRTVKVADKSGMVNLSLWNEPGKVLQSGDIIRISRAYTGMFKAMLTVYTTKFGDFFKVGDFCMLFSEAPNMSEPNAEMAAQFEKEDAERKAERANRNNSSAQGKGGGQSASRPPSTSSNQGSDRNKGTWGTQAPGASRGGSGSGSSAPVRQQHRSKSKEKR